VSIYVWPQVTCLSVAETRNGHHFLLTSVSARLFCSSCWPPVVFQLEKLLHPVSMVTWPVGVPIWSCQWESPVYRLYDINHIIINYKVKGLPQNFDVELHVVWLTFNWLQSSHPLFVKVILNKSNLYYLIVIFKQLIEWEYLKYVVSVII